MATAALFALAIAGCGHRETPTSEQPSPIFRDAAAESGLHFQHTNGATGKFHLPEIMGSGVALFDYDNDGDQDVYLVQGAPPARNKLFRNELIPSGSLRFTDVSSAAGVDHSSWGMGVATSDYDSDGDTDLLVTNFGPNVLYRNDGNGRFTDASDEAGIRSNGWHTSAAFVDYDRDGDPDLFIARYVDFTFRTSKTCRGTTGTIDYCTPRVYRGVLDRLFRNEGNGRFTEVTAAAGITRPGPGLGVVCTDIDRDGWPDIYVANDGDANHLWHNQKNGTFKEVALEAGTAYSEDGQPQAGMGVTAGDYDLDADEDLFVTNLTREGATLYRNDGGYFTDVSATSALRPQTFADTGFGTQWFDYDNDGILDLFIANGAVTIMESQRGRPQPFKQSNQLLRGLAGRKFQTVPTGVEHQDVSRGAAFGDIDNDGDLDIVVSNNGGPARLLLNQLGSKNRWLAVRAASGASLLIERENAPPLLRRAASDGSYLSANQDTAWFGLGQTSPSALVVQWPDGLKEQWSAPEVRRVHIVRRGSGAALQTATK